MKQYIFTLVNTSLSLPIGQLCYYQDPNLSIDYLSLTDCNTGNVTGAPRGMRGTRIVGGTFSSGDQTPAFC